MASPGKPIIDPDKDFLANWMMLKWSQIHEKPLWQIAIPGAHDALTLDGTAMPGFSYGSAAQGQTFAKQLEFGIRYFDLRFKWDGETFYGEHGDVSFYRDPAPNSTKIFNDLKHFLASHPFEIVILSFRSTGGSDEIRKNLISSMLNTIGREKFVDHAFVQGLPTNPRTPAGCTPQQLRAGKKQAIVLCEVESHEMDWPLLWQKGDEYFQITPPSGARTLGPTKDIEPCRTEDLAWWDKEYSVLETSGAGSSPYFWRLGVHTTWTAIPVGGLIGGAMESVPIVVDLLKRDDKWKKRRWNIVSADLFTEEHYRSFATAVIECNGHATYAKLELSKWTPSFTFSGAIYPEAQWTRASSIRDQKATGIEVRYQNDYYGIVNARILSGNNQVTWTSDNGEGDVKTFQMHGDGSIVGVELRMGDGDQHRGITNLRAITDDGTKNPWLVGQELKPYERQYAFYFPKESHLAGLMGKERGTYGLVDMVFRYSLI